MISSKLSRRLERLEARYAPPSLPDGYDPREELMKELNRLAERMKADGDWPQPEATPEEVEECLRALSELMEKNGRRK